MNTYEQQLELVNRKLATAKTVGHLTTFKYAKKVMYDYLWFQPGMEPLMECRGHTYDNRTGALVQAAPRKSFNYLEDGRWWSDVAPDAEIEVYKKINGYMACATKYQGELVVTTTGTSNSEYAQWAKELIAPLYPPYSGENDAISWLYEIVVPKDPHIVNERFGAHSLGGRYKDDGLYVPVGQCVGKMSLEDAFKLAESDRGEGFMLWSYTESSQYQSCAKLKTPYYIGKKKLMRAGAKTVQQMYFDPDAYAKTLPKMWYDTVVTLPKIYSCDFWTNLPEQTRRECLEAILG